MKLHKNIERAQLVGIFSAGTVGAIWGGLVGLKAGCWLLGVTKETGMPEWRSR